MMSFKRKFVSVVTAGAMVLNTASAGFAATTIEISGNGAVSDNTATVNQSNTTTVNQNNTANVTNTINTSANTGGNSASFNTGGGSVIDTGNASATIDVQNNLNSNAASVDCGGCNGENTTVSIADNGAFSDNNINLRDTSTTRVNQDNVANIRNDINTNLNTGDNRASFNTNGDVDIRTGDATANIDVRNRANSNVATSGNGGSVTPTMSFRILGNGAESDNRINARIDRNTHVNQDNNADINNDIDVHANTGDNSASFNTGGDVFMLTGDANADVTVDNMVNFNAADLDCGCMFGDVRAVIDDNGAFSDNTLRLTLDNQSRLDQDNNSRLDNNVDLNDLTTGNNRSSLNTDRRGDGENVVVTGNADSTVDIRNSGNVNVVGESSVELPFDFNGTNVGFTFDLRALLAFFGISR